MANEMTIVTKEQEVIKSIQYYRLKKELELLEHEKNVADNGIESDTKWYNLLKNTKNAINNKKSLNRSEDIVKVEKAIKKFESDNANINYKLCINGNIRNTLFELYADDKYDLQKIMLAVSIILDDSYKYKYENLEYEEISKIIFGNGTKITELKNILKDNYTAIAAKNLSTFQKGALIGLGTGAILLAVCVPIIVAGGIAVAGPVTTATLAGLGFGDMQLGIGIAALIGLLCGGALYGASFAAMKTHNILAAKHAFNKLNPDESALLLSIKTLLIEEAKKVMSEDEFKEYLSEMLEAVDALKSDTEYVLFVEKKNIKINKDKIDIFYNWHKRLMKKVFDL